MKSSVLFPGARVAKDAPLAAGIPQPAVQGLVVPSDASGFFVRTGGS
jgi:hypothetical protein